MIWEYQAFSSIPFNKSRTDEWILSLLTPFFESIFDARELNFVCTVPNPFPLVVPRSISVNESDRSEYFCCVETVCRHKPTIATSKNFI